MKSSNSTLVQPLWLPADKQNKTFPQDPFGYPLLLTADSKLRLFEKSYKALLSKYFHLFPTCQDRFVHEDLLELQYSRTYFLCTSDDQNVLLNVTNELLRTILPGVLRGNIVHNACDHIKYHYLKEVWKCLTGEVIFSSVLQAVVKMWALLLSTNNTLFCYSSSDCCLPIIPLEASTEDSKGVVTSVQAQNFTSNAKQLSNVLRCLPNVPFLDTDVVPVVPYQAVSNICPKFSKPETILRNLYYVQQINDLTEFMTENAVRMLMQYLTAINFKLDSVSCNILRQLPCFETIDGNFTHLDRKKVFAWPSRLLRTGYRKWISKSDLIFLEAYGAWTGLRVQTELRINVITEEDVYVQLVFPNFDKMNHTERHSHLNYIRVYLFSNNHENSQHEDGNIRESALKFISALKELKCLENSKELLMTIKSFCDHEKYIFTTFSYYFRFIPQHFQELKKTNNKEYMSWMNFFRKLGLQGTLTSAEYCTLCFDTANGTLGWNTRKASSELVSYLLYHESQNHMFLTDPFLLKKISTIPFVCCVRSPELEWIHHSCSTKNSIILPDNQEITMCTLEGSCEVKHKELLWTVKPVVHLPPSVSMQVLRNLGVVTQPENYVLENIANLSKTPFAQSSIFHKYTAPQCKPDHTSLMEVMVENFEALNKNCKNMGSNFSRLKNIPCIPVNTHPPTFPVLVKPQHVIFDKKADQFYPFLHSAPLQLYSIATILKEVGIAESIQLEHVQIMLQQVFDENSHSMEMDPGTLKSVTSALDCLIYLLKESKGKIEVVAQKLDPLYLLATDNQLHHVSNLVYCDKPAYEFHSLDLAETGLYMLKIWGNISSTQVEKLCDLLPEAVRPKPLSLLCSETLSPLCQECPTTEYAQKLQQALQITNLPQAMIQVFRHITKDEQLSDEFEEQLPVFLNNIEVVCMDDLQIDITLVYEDKQYVVASPHVECHMQTDAFTYRLYLDSDVSDMEYGHLLESVSKRSILIVEGAKQLENYRVKELVRFDEDLFRAKSEEQVYKYLRKNRIGTGGLDSITDDILEPKLGDTIPKS